MTDHWCSINGASKTLEDTEKGLRDILPHMHTPENAPGEKSHRVVYAVHELFTSSSTAEETTPSRFIGFVALRSLNSSMLDLPSSFFPPQSPPYLVVELSYQLLSSSWSHGFATESLSAVFDACRVTKDFWSPWERVYVRAIVNAPNAASLRVVEKAGLREVGVYVWEGEKVWMAGRWTGREELRIWGAWLLG